MSEALARKINRLHVVKTQLLLKEALEKLEDVEDADYDALLLGATLTDLHYATAHRLKSFTEDNTAGKVMPKNM